MGWPKPTMLAIEVCVVLSKNESLTLKMPPFKTHCECFSFTEYACATPANLPKMVFVTVEFAL